MDLANLQMATSETEPAPAAAQITYGPGKTIKDWLPGLIERTFGIVVILVLSSLVYFGITHFFFEAVEVHGQSMYPTLRNADHYFLNRWAYHTHSPQRGDVVVIKDPTDGVLAVKRIVAMAGESVSLKNGSVYVNGSKLDESYLPPETHTYPFKENQFLVLCGKNQYFVMGDNRGNSFDSRIYGPVPRQNILGVITP